MTRQPWIYSPFVDGLFILAIPFLIVAATLLCGDYFRPADSMTVVSWAILVMGVDVSHVYSTIYRTYLDKETMQRHGLFLMLLPFAVLIICLLLYLFGAQVFWRVMAYVAVFHFARQQYGFLRVYSRHENPSAFARRIDALAIYTATLYPILDWHLAGQKSFNWFMNGDFFYFAGLCRAAADCSRAQEWLATARTLAWFAYLGIMGLYLVKEVTLLWKSITARRQALLRNSIATKNVPWFNLPRNAILAGTLLSWYVGIIHFNSDLAFTAINVMSHGIPYIALVWIYGRKKYNNASGAGLEQMPTWSMAQLFRPRYILFFIVSLLLLAYVEEGLWDAWVWHEKNHQPLFDAFHALVGGAGPESSWLKLLVPLLSVPQITHYIIDGFIWKIRRDKYGWSDITFGHGSTGSP